MSKTAAVISESLQKANYIPFQNLNLFGNGFESSEMKMILERAQVTAGKNDESTLSPSSTPPNLP